MKIIIGKPNGFCFGVRRAIAIVKREAKKSINKTKIYTLGPIVHNAQVANELKNLGVKTISNINRSNLAKAKGHGDSVVVIRSHGCAPSVVDRLKKLGYRVVDATCPYVKRVQNYAARLKQEGFLTIVIGDKHHPEVKGILGYASPQGIVFHYKTNGRNSKLPIPNSKFIRNVGIIGQTTLPLEDFRSAVNSLLEFKLNSDYTEVRIINTLCKESLSRQKTCQQIAQKVDLMLVVGSRHSANTLSLANIAKKIGTKVFQVEDKQDLDSQIRSSKFEIRNLNKIGVIAGASTPQDTVLEVVQELKKYAKQFSSTANFRH